MKYKVPNTTKKLTTVLSATLALALGVPPAVAQKEKTKGKDPLVASARTFTTVAKETTPSVVFIEVEKTVAATGMGSPFGSTPFGSNDPSELFGDDLLRRFFGERGFRPPRDEDGEQPRYLRRGQGSGFIVDEQGYILSNSHVVGEADKITVHLHDGRELEAELIGTDPESEVAVIKIASEDDGEEFPVIPLGDSSELEIGEWVVAIGNPFGLTETLTVGVVSARGRSNLGIANYENFIQTDAAINPGNSGGPLLNIDGEAVGINTAIFSRSGGYMGIGFAIPSNMAAQIMSQLIKTGKVERGFLGVVIQPVTQDLAKAFGLEDSKGIIVAQVTDDSPAARAGLKQGDVIVELDGGKVKNVGSFRNAIASASPGEKVTLGVLRDKKRRKIEVKVGARDPEALAQFGGSDESSAGELGFEVQDLSTELAKRFGYEGQKGVLISEVARGTAASLAGLKPGQLITEIDRKPVTSVREFNKALAASKKDSDVALLLVTDGETSRFVTLSLEE